MKRLQPTVDWELQTAEMVLEEQQEPNDMQQLDDLPASDNKFWDGEVNRIELEEPKKFFDQIHYFERVSSRQAYCEHCDYGFEVDPGDIIENGHLYTKDGKLVI